MKDLHNKIHVLPVITPVAARTDNTAVVGTIIDRKGFEALEFAIIIGANTDANATFTVLIEDGNNSGLSDNAAVADAQLLGTEVLASFDFADDGETRKIGYVGDKRYVRMTITPAGNDSGNIFLAAVAVLGRPLIAPTINPPA
jgi:hypothetical protein